MSSAAPANGASGGKPVKGKGVATKDPNAERYLKLTKATVYVPAPIFNFTDFPDIYFEGQILGKDNDPKNKGCMVVKFTNYKDKYFFPLDALEEWVEKYGNVPKSQVRDFSTWGPELELNLRAGLPPPPMPPADSKPNSSSTGPDRKRKHLPGQPAKGGVAAARGPMLTPEELVGRDVVIPAPMLHKPGNEVFRGRVMAVHLTIPDDLLIMLYDDPAGVFQLGASEVARLLAPDHKPAKKQATAAAVAAGKTSGSKAPKKPVTPSAPVPAAAAPQQSKAYDAAAGVAGAAPGVKQSSAAAAAAVPSVPGQAPAPAVADAALAAGAAPAGGSTGVDGVGAAAAANEEGSSKVKPVDAAGATAGPAAAADTVGMAFRDQNQPAA